MESKEIRIQEEDINNFVFDKGLNIQNVNKNVYKY